MDSLKLLRGKDIYITDKIKIHIPTLNEICDYGEKEYFTMINNLTAIPSDMMSFLYDNGIDYEKISEYDLFCAILRHLDFNTNILFGENINLDELHNCSIDNQVVLCKIKDGNVDKNSLFIDEFIYSQIVDILRDVHFIKKEIKIAGNEITKNVLIDLDREDKKIKKQYKSILEPLILALINCADSHFSYSNVWDVPISVFLNSVNKVQKVKNVDYLMHGVYSGNVDVKKISKEDMSFI